VTVPVPTPIYRLVHFDNLSTILRRGALHSPHHSPKDRLPYRTIHNISIQQVRHSRPIPCGPGGTLHDYVAFYFGFLPPMLLQLKTGRVAGYDEGQIPLIYLLSSAQAVVEAGLPFVFSDGHGIAAFSRWYDDLARLDHVDWDMVYQRYWADNPEDPDRQRRKQAEFLVHRRVPWSLIQEIRVFNEEARGRVQQMLSQSGATLIAPVKICPGWYY
jgi:hypothetical protein